MKLTADMIDKRICDCEDCSNTQTYREFIVESYLEFGLGAPTLDQLKDDDLDRLIDFCDDLYMK